jgi:hypothetical protein
MADTKPKHTSLPSMTDERYEKTDARLNAVIIVSLLIVAAAVMSAVAVWYYYSFALDKLRIKQAMVAKRPGPAAEIPEDMPKLEINSPINLKLYNEEKQARLHSYGWVSREVQVVHIPIERAIELTAERKLPSQPVEEFTTATARDNGADLPQDSSSGRTSWNLQR